MATNLYLFISKVSKLYRNDDEMKNQNNELYPLFFIMLSHLSKIF